MKQTRKVSLMFISTLVVSISIMVAGFFVISVDAASPPSTMNFQGRLRDSADKVVTDGQYNMQFRIYTVSTGGTAVWSETRQTTNRVQVTNGLFSVQLGEVTPLPASLFNATNLYFEITMATPATATCSTAGCASWESPMTPRNKLATSAYAFNAALLNGKSDADFAAASGSTNYIQNTTDPQTANFNVTGTGKVGTALTVGNGTTHGVVMRDVNVGRGTNSNLVALNSDGGSNRAAFYASSSGGNTFEAGGTSGWSSKVTTSATNIGLVVQGASSQSADLLQLQNSSGNPVAKVDASGNLTVGNVNAGAVVASNGVTVGAGKTISMVGGTTSLRPASPSEGTIYFDSETKQLLVYANGSWQPLNGASGGAADGKTATKIVAASNSPQAIKDSADYVADGTADQVEINSALTAATGGKVYLAEGLYTVDAAILVPNNTTLQGAGNGTEIQFADVDVTKNMIEATGTSRTGQVIRDLKLNGRSDINTVGSQSGIYLQDVGSVAAPGGGVVQKQGAQIANITAINFRAAAIVLYTASVTSVTDNFLHNNSTGISTDLNSRGNTVASNTISESSVGVSIGSDNNIIANNTISGVGQGVISSFAKHNVISTNHISNTSGEGVLLYEEVSDTVVDGNYIYEAGDVTLNNAIYLDAAFGDNKITGNYIFDTNHSSSNTAIYIDGSQTYVADNVLNGGVIDDVGTGTIYANQLDGSGKLISRSSGGFAVQNTSGTDVLNVSSTTSLLTVSGDTLFKPANSATAVVIQNSTSTALFTADTQNNKVIIGSATNGIEFSANGIVLKGTARKINTIRLSPEYPGATFTGDGTDNNGSLSSDFCGNALIGINASKCGSRDSNSYYQWSNTETTAQDYDIFVRFKIPEDYDNSGTGPVLLSVDGFVADTSTDSVFVRVYSGTGDLNGSGNAATASGDWTNVNLTTALYYFAPGDEAIIQITLTAGQDSFALVGDITLSYRANR